MLNHSDIKNADELEFAVFCIENMAIRLGKKRRHGLSGIGGTQHFKRLHHTRI